MDNDTNAFYDAIAEYYPLFYKDWETQLQREGLSLRSIFRGRDVQSVLVTAAGVGTQAVPLAELGYEVVATDPSAGMLRKAMQTAEGRGVLDKIRFERSSFAELPEVVGGQYDAIICKGNALPHLLTDDDIETALLTFLEMLNPGGTLVIGMRDFDYFIQHRPRFLPGFDHVDDEDQEFITFEIWEWEDGPPMIATQNLYMVKGHPKHLNAIKRSVKFRPLSVDEVKVVLLELGYEDFQEYPDRWEQVVYVRKPKS
ncbi:MAG: class I SAM-dependent methyltransferase [Anaerolineae bacterium]|nr:class I SAM-dependent methyltransferase [Anaerolineae bacterium]